MVRIATLASVSALQLLAVGTPANLGLWAMCGDVLGLQWHDSQLGQDFVRLVFIIDLVALLFVCLQVVRKRVQERSQTPAWAPSLCVFAWQLIVAGTPENPGLWAMWAVVLGLPLHDSELGKEFARIVLTIDLMVLTLTCAHLVINRTKNKSVVPAWALKKLFLPASLDIQYVAGDVPQEFVTKESMACCDVTNDEVLGCNDAIIKEAFGCRVVQTDVEGNAVTIKKQAECCDRMSDYNSCADELPLIF